MTEAALKDADASLDDGLSGTATRKKLPFPKASGRERGYEPEAVESFLSTARAAFEAGGDDSLTAAGVRETAFPLVKHGYRIDAVDAALGRIEDAFAARERQRAIAARGAESWVSDARRDAQEILDRLSRQRKNRFDRVGAFSHGYAIDEVDAVADRISAYLRTGESLTADQVRRAAFRMTRRGYREDQVDAVLDAVVRIVLAVR